LIAPAIIGELFIYYFSVKGGEERAEKIDYRMLKIRINTKAQNDAMFSTDDEGEENEGT
jgi:hypothetical protein